jgi:hypothetical protein
MKKLNKNTHCWSWKMIVLTYNIVPQSKFAPIKMNLAHNDASLQQSLVTPFATLPLSIAVCVSCDNNELRDNVVYLPLTKLMLQHVKRVLNDIHDVSKYVHCLVNKKDELELLSSFNTLCYICGRTNLNYTGSSTQVLSQGLQRASNGVTPWPVG